MLPSVSDWTASLAAEFSALEAEVRPVALAHPRADAWRLASLLGRDLSRPQVFLLPDAVADVEIVLAGLQGRRPDFDALLKRGLR